MGATKRGIKADAGDAPGEPIIDLRDGEARYLGVAPPSPYGYDSVLPDEWRRAPGAPIGMPSEKPAATTRGQLPKWLRVERSFPPLQRIVYRGPVIGREIAVKLTVAESMVLHTTGIERPLTDLNGRLNDRVHLEILTDAFGRDRRVLGGFPRTRPRTLTGAKREWHRQIAAFWRHGFALSDRHLVLLEYVPPERDPRQRDFAIAYKRIVMAYQLAPRPRAAR